MDFSDYPSDHELFSNENKKKIGFLKDETGSDPITEVIAIKSKMYLVKTLTDVKKRAKGVQSSVLNKEINYDSYYRCIFDEQILQSTKTRIQSS